MFSYNPMALVALGLVFLGTSAPTEATSFTCPEYAGYYANPLDCNSFYQCDHWIATLMPCPPTLHWDVAAVTCNLPELANCQESTPEPPVTTTESPPRPSTTTCRPAGSTEGDHILSDDEPAHFVVKPREDGVCPEPPVDIPIEEGQKINITITFQLALHPLDVYYLMDFSGSMSDDKQNLVSLSAELVKTVANLTNDGHLGFGAFVDKPHWPLGDSSDYSFHNTMPLTDSMEDLTANIEATEIMSGSDWPESAGDAMFQAAACGSKIGWRSNTRRLMIVATDATFHLAGDGAPYGMSPFDQGCYLSEAGFYSEELVLDYPSEQQIVDVMSQEGVIVVFAVTSDVSAYYEGLADKIPSSVVGILSHDSSNIIKLIIDQYHLIESTVKVEQSETTEEITIKYFSSCGGVTELETMICEKLEGGDVTFTVEIDLSICPTDPEMWNQVVRINPLGLPSTFIDIALSLICTL